MLDNDVQIHNSLNFFIFEGLPDPPKNVQIETGPQDGTILISWRPVPQATKVLPNFENEPLVQGYTVCINDHPVCHVPGNESKLQLH